MGQPWLESRSTELWKMIGFAGVVIIVTSTPCMAKSLTMSTTGLGDWLR